MTVLGAPPPTPPSVPISTQYYILEHLRKTHTQISILDLLKSSPTHQEILNRALQKTHVPGDIDPTQFQALVAHLSTTYHLSFTQCDAMFPDPNYIHPLNIELVIKHYKLKRVLIDNGSTLNLCTLKFIMQIGYIVKNLYNQCITIKAYDNVEKSSVGMINLPIQVGPIIQDTLCHIVDLDLPFNILLGRPWIHVMQVVSSTYHQCLKFPYQGYEITIHGALNHLNFVMLLKHLLHIPIIAQVLML